MRKNTDFYLVDVKAGADPWAAAFDRLQSSGFVALRNLFDREQVEDLAKRTHEVFSRPALGGSMGYYRKDPHKRLFDPLLLGRNVVDVVTNERVFDLVERYLGGDFTLAELNAKHDDGTGEVYFGLHSDFSAGWRMGNYPVVLTQEDMSKPIAVGGMFYLDDTTDGAFCYAEGTQSWGAPKGADVADYPKADRDKIMEALVRVEGQRGDLVLFDDRGFHGPEQPVTVSRTVYLFDYYKDAVFGHANKAPIPVLINDIGHLNKRQLQVLGLGAESMATYESYHTRRFGSHRHYGPLARLFEGFFSFDRAKAKLKKTVKRAIGRGASTTASTME